MNNRTQNPPPAGRLENLIDRSRKAFLPGLVLLAGVTTAQAQWTGSGAGGSGTNFNDTANWTGGTVNGNFTGNTTTATLALSGDVALTDLNFGVSGSFDLTLNGNGTGASEVISLAGNIYLSRAAASAGKLTIGSDVTLDLGSITTTRQIQWGASATGASYGALVINGLLTGTASGSGKIQTASSGAVSVSLTNDNNTFSAPLIIAGSLSFSSIKNVGGGASALGSATTSANGTITLQRNSIFNYTGSADQSSDRQLLVNASQGPITIRHSGTGGVLTYSSDLALGTNKGDLNLQVLNADATMEFSGMLSNSGAGVTAVTVSSAGGYGTLILSNQGNTYTGSTTLTSGGVVVVTKLADGGAASSIGSSSSDAANLVFGSWAYNPVLRYIGSGDSTDRLFTLPREGGTIESSGSGALHFTNTGEISTAGPSNRDTTSRVLTLGGTNTGENSFAASLADHTYGTGQVTTSRIVKTGAGKWIITGTHSYTGTTSVGAGTLFVDGSLTSGITVNAGLFGGSGSTTGNVVIGNASGVRDAKIAAGGGAGGFTTSGGLEFKSDAEFVFTFDSTTGAATPLSASGITINSSAFFSFTDLGNRSGVGLNDVFILLENTGPGSIVGTFTNLANAASFASNGITWQASYSGGTGNDLVLIATAVSPVPEPGTFALIAGLVTGSGVWLRRRRTVVAATQAKF